jgi:hypothetical protein
VDEFLDDFLEHPEWFAGFDKHRDIARMPGSRPTSWTWSTAASSNQALAAPRPLHGNTYKFRNAKHTRDYGAAEQIYWMLFYARKGKGQAGAGCVEALLLPRRGPGDGPLRTRALQVDVETQAILRLDHQVTQDMKDSKEPARAFRPLCIGQADIMADDYAAAYWPTSPTSRARCWWTTSRR